MTRPELIERLKGLAKTARPGYADFIRRLNPTAAEILGVPLPLLRKEAKTADLDVLTDKTLEEQLLAAMLIGKSKDIEKIRAFVPKIRDWAVNDTLASECKFMAKDRAEYFPFVLSLNRGGEFDGRIALILLNNHFITDEYIDGVLQFAGGVNQDFYYTKMAAAWLTATCYEKFPEKTFAFLSKNTLPMWTHNKAIRKACESYKVSKQNKERIKHLLRV